MLFAKKSPVSGIYEAQREGKYGIIDVKGNIKLYIENDAIGLDISKFEKNDIRNKYLLVDNLIPVKKNDLWGLVDKTVIFEVYYCFLIFKHPTCLVYPLYFF